MKKEIDPSIVKLDIGFDFESEFNTDGDNDNFSSTLKKSKSLVL